MKSSTAYLWVSFLSLIFLTGPLSADTGRVVRFWVGQQKTTSENLEENTLNSQRHLEFIRNALAPATVLQGGLEGGSSLDYCGVFIPPQQTPPGSQLAAFPFSEAALPSYLSAEGYEASRAAFPGYGPLHSKADGFAGGVSYSAVPRFFGRSDFLNGVQFATASKGAEGKVAYDLRHDKSRDADWHEGSTLVWLMARKSNIDQKDYVNTLANQFSRFDHGSLEEKGAFGHYARVDDTFVLHFINVVNPDDINAVMNLLAKEAEELANVGNFVEPILAKKITPFYMVEKRKNVWDQSIDYGKAVNVQFKPSARGVVQQFFSLFNAGDIEGAFRLVDDNVRWWVPGYLPFSGEKSKAQYLGIVSNITKGFPNGFKLNVSSIVQQGNTLAVEAQSEGTHLNGKKYNNHYHFLFKVNSNGKIVRVKEYMDTLHLYQLLIPTN